MINCSLNGRSVTFRQTKLLFSCTVSLCNRYSGVVTRIVTHKLEADTELWLDALRCLTASDIEETLSTKKIFLITMSSCNLR